MTLPNEQGKGLYKDMTAIDNRGIATEWYTPRFFCAREKAMAMAQEILYLYDAKGAPLDGWESYQRRFGHWGKAWDDLIGNNDFEPSRYERMARRMMPVSRSSKRNL
jgi:hypothetical protein